MVRVSFALDVYEDLSWPVSQWVAKTSDWEVRAERTKAVADAIKEHDLFLQQNPSAVSSGGLRHEPHVFYSPHSDGPAFLFKYDNNGTTVVVGECLGALKDEWDPPIPRRGSSKDASKALLLAAFVKANRHG